jgi:hypothetical protein
MSIRNNVPACNTAMMNTILDLVEAGVTRIVMPKTESRHSLAGAISSEYRRWRIMTGEGIQTAPGRTAKEAAQNQYRTTGRMAYSIALIPNTKLSHEP